MHGRTWRHPGAAAAAVFLGIVALDCVGVNDDCSLTATCLNDAVFDAGSKTVQTTTPTCGAAPPTGDAGAMSNCGIFANPTAPTIGDGSRSAPFRSLQQAIDAAAAAQLPVFACAKEFAEAIRVPSGLTVYGGLDCDEDWTWTGAVRTRVVPAASVTTIGGSEVAVRLEAGQGVTVLDDVDVEASAGHGRVGVLDRRSGRGHRRNPYAMCAHRR